MLIKLLLTVLALCVSAPSYAVVYWDDEMEVFTGSSNGTPSGLPVVNYYFDMLKTAIEKT